MHEKASIGAMLKGAGLAAMAEELEKQKLEREKDENADSTSLLNKETEMVEATPTVPKTL